MISYIKGELTEIEKDKVIVEAGGIGYGIFMSPSAVSRLPLTGNEVRIYTYFHVKEDSMQLYGFLTKDDLEVFKLVIGVSGIGPKGGLNILTALTPDDLRYAVFSNDVKAISSAPGIGKKTAEKLILELKDKLRMEDVLENAGNTADAAGSAQSAGTVQNEAVQALAALGYGSTEALKAVRQVAISDETTVEEVLKQALKYMMF